MAEFTTEQRRVLASIQPLTRVTIRPEGEPIRLLTGSVGPESEFSLTWKRRVHVTR